MHNCQLTEKLVEDLSEGQDVRVAEEYPDKGTAMYEGLIVTGLVLVVAGCLMLANV